ncbi:MAG: class I SAM-dependent methyltransferase [Acidobacteria bacterium]|nr:class I SAM-dependent methyltransferase [Acidobacteriota bacterium]MBI3427168.1 class I SAM-dependent methyltransferase [Acidobacteriota bacterium]
MWDERYAELGYAYGTEPNDFLVAHAARIPAGRVLCLAEGPGRNAVWLAQQGYEVTAVDLSAVGLAKARQLAAERGVSITTIQADLAEYIIEAGAWDGIVSIFCHLPVLARQRLYGQIAAGLRAGGVFLLEAYAPRQLEFGTGGPSSIELLVPLAAVRSELVGLEWEIAHEVEREIYEGRLHTGQSAVVQLLGKKAAPQAG